MKSRWSWLLVCYALVSILVLAWNCGPTCEINDSAASSQAGPCHQEPTSDDSQACDWDTGSLSIKGDGSAVFQLVAPSVSYWFVFTSLDLFSGLESKSFQAILLSSHFSAVSHLSFIRILV
ncbi:hypothetical protein EHQ53_09595 [Leptospira langatensis]|uniref:Uncharacterized protein n=1 Tax=Leptospira langatensis TaxID=2484983 RepID=A0A5F1ZV30_9LEPT|nr:hypothetical protein [Leptospira langatensis]TGK00306.1 hypothetical protein EHO57_13595 [Leptospira langatensis]TGL41058.1 hypothetical protein EHQ53_09595 [Leptospira langatensis]